MTLGCFQRSSLIAFFRPCHSFRKNGIICYKAEEDIVPHITIQMYPGRDDETKKRLAQAVLETASKELKREKEHFSVSVVDVPQEEWKGKVYDKVLADKNTIIQPGYKM